VTAPWAFPPCDYAPATVRVFRLSPKARSVAGAFFVCTAIVAADGRVGAMGLVRLFLASIVVADHWWLGELTPKAFDRDDVYKAGFNSGYAVMFFYIISGFLITYTLSRNYRLDVAGVGSFYRNRFVRIFSLYWPMVLLTFLVLPDRWQMFLQAAFWDEFTGIFLIGQDWRVAFATYPKPHFAAALETLHQAWTLGAELSFYLLAPLLMRSWLAGAAVLIASFGMRTWFVQDFGPDLQDIWSYHFIGSTIGFFMMGHLICLASQRWRLLRDEGLCFCALALSIVSMAYATSYTGFDTPRFWCSAVFFMLALPGLFEATKGIRWMNAVGDLSYPLYLVHTVLLVLIGDQLASVILTAGDGSRSAAYASVAAFVAISILAALVVHRFLEVPTAGAMHAALRPQRVVPKAAE
jgi:peptidoglycan/LPS O-acetylase OafA/YrhL